MNQRTTVVVRIVAAVALLLFAGCSARRAAHLGIRPDPTPFSASTPACQRFEEVTRFSQDLQEAYHSRASQNRWWIYVAGTLMLGTAAATGGLAAAGGATLSIALLSISGTASSGFFAFLDNSTLADVYTISANDLADGLRDAQLAIKYETQKVPWPGPSDPPVEKFLPTQVSCEEALRILETKLTKAQTQLEIGRTDSAAAAVIRAQAELRKINEVSKQVENDSLRRAVQGGRITAIVWPPKSEEANLTVSGADLSKVNLTQMGVKVGETRVPAKSLTSKSSDTYVVTFVPPEKPDAIPDAGRTVSLVFPDANVEILALPDVKLKKPAS